MSDSAGSIAASDRTARGFFGHPKGLAILFMTEMWERFSYYGMRTLLVLYLTQHFLYSDSFSASTYGAYTSLVYLMPVIGGLLADRYLGSRKAVRFGAILLVLGHLSMAIEGPPATEYITYEGQSYEVVAEGRGDARVQFLQTPAGTFRIGASAEGLALEGVPAGAGVPTLFPEGAYTKRQVRDPIYERILYLSLALIIIGVGFLKANISTIVGSLYERGDRRRDAGFTIFYMGINTGSFLSTLLCGYLGTVYGWNYGFGLAGIGMLFGLVVFQWGQRYLEGHGEPPDPPSLKERVLPFLSREHAIYLGGVLAVGLSWWLVQNNAVVGYALGATALAAIFGVMSYSWVKFPREERNRMGVALFLSASSVLFWMLFEQAGSSMTLYAARNSHLSVFGLFDLKAAQVQFFNPGFIILLAPFFSWLWIKLADKGLEPSTPAKFGLGLMQAGLGFLVLVLGATQFVDGNAKVGLFWLAAAYFLHTTGELCLSPVGLSMITKLSVTRLVGLMMGIWFLGNAGANFLAGVVAAQTESETVGGQVLDPFASLETYVGVFQKIGLMGIGFGIFVLLLTPFLRKRMHGVH